MISFLFEFHIKHKNITYLKVNFKLFKGYLKVKFQNIKVK